MPDKLRIDILNLLEEKCERGATLGVIASYLRLKVIEESVDKSVNEIADVLDNLVKDDLIEKKCLRKSSHPVYKIRKFR